MKLLYKPFSIVGRVVGARVGRSAFTALWDGITDSPKPSPNDPEAGLLKITGSAALEAATLAASAALFNQLSSRLFHYLFGVWPDRGGKEDDAQLSA
jgi:hypothetical protein